MSNTSASVYKEAGGNISTARFLMCAPERFEVSYEINQWMQPEAWRNNSVQLKRDAQKQWQQLCQTLQSSGATIGLVDQQPGVPDMVFTANAAVVLDGRVLLSRFHYKERQPEEKYFAQYFQNLKEKGIVKTVDEFPSELKQEGAGDCLWDSKRQMFWAGFGPRSSKEAASYIETYYGKEVVSLELLSSRFYHLDLSLSPLSGGEIFYYPQAFTEQSQKVIKERVPHDQLIALDQEDAFSFICNLVNLGDKIILSHISAKLKHKLKELGYSVIEAPVDAFGLAGGAVCCLTLRLDWQSK